MEQDLDRIGILNSFVGYHLRRAHAEFLHDFSMEMSDNGMRQVLVGVLAVVHQNPGINQGSVGKLLRIKRANMVALVNELVERDFLIRVTDPEDRRAFALKLTKSGEEQLEDCQKRSLRHEQRMLADFTPAEIEVLTDLLRRIGQHSRAEDR